jgi:hypothetical protein
LEARKMLGVSWWQFTIGGFSMGKTYEAFFSELGQVAAGAKGVEQAFVCGVSDFGAIRAGQVCGKIEDIPSIREVVEQTVAEAQEKAEFPLHGIPLGK